MKKLSLCGGWVRKYGILRRGIPAWAGPDVWPKRPMILAVAALALAAPLHAEAVPKTLLFVDEHDILYRSGTKKVVHPLKKFPGNSVIAPDKPWEAMIGWNSQYRDPKSGKFQMWYQAYSGRGEEDKRLSSVVCYAESDDGKTWTKPALELFPFFDEKQTNIVLAGAGGYGDRYSNSVVVDERETDPAKRYKMTYYDWGAGSGPEDGPAMHVAFSPDGIHWTKHPGPVAPMMYGAKGHDAPFLEDGPFLEQPEGKGRARKAWLIPLAAMSGASDVFYDPLRERFVTYGKLWIQGPDGAMGWKQGMGRMESEDFIAWTKPELILTPNDNDPPRLEFNNNPVFFHNGMYLCLNQIMDRTAGTVDAEFISSRDGFKWDRSFANQPMIARGGEDAFDAGAILTNSTPIVVGEEMWFYYGAYRGPISGGGPPSPPVPGNSDHRSGVGLATILKDRFVGIVPNADMVVNNNRKPEKLKKGELPKKVKPLPPNTVGQITLRPRDLSGVRELQINADASQGEVRVEIMDAKGYRLRGFSFDDAVPITGDGVALPAAWKEKSLKDLPPGKFTIRIHLKSAEVFACTLE